VQVETGSHRIEVAREGHRPHLETVDVATGETTVVRAELEPIAAGEENETATAAGAAKTNWPGWVLFGGGAALAAVGLYFTVVTVGHNGDSGEFHDLRARYPGSGDVCAEPTLTASDKDLCDGASLQSTLQFVFYGAGAIAGGIGLFLLLGGSSETDAEAGATALRLEPSVFASGGGFVLSGGLP
jgi:hypothetical protein